MSRGGSVCQKPINWSAATPNTRWVKDDEDDGDELGDGDKADNDDHVNTLCRGSKHIAVHWGSKMMVRMRISRHFGQ